MFISCQNIFQVSSQIASKPLAFTLVSNFVLFDSVLIPSHFSQVAIIYHTSIGVEWYLPYRELTQLIHLSLTDGYTQVSFSSYA